MSDEPLDTLLVDIRNGSPEAFEKLLSLVQKTVYSFGLKVCGQTEDAKDTMQTTLLKAFQALPDLEMSGSKPLKVWLYKVARNACLMMRRKGKYEPAQNLSLDDFFHSAQQFEPRDGSDLPVDFLIKDELRSTVRNAVQKLPHPYRLVLVLRDMEGLSTKEAAEVLDISEDTVKIRLHRARLFLRKELEPSFAKAAS